MDEKADLDWCNWMKYLDGKERVIDSYIPGSHDSSAYEYGNSSVDGLNDFEGSITQSQNYYGQLCAGVRYFDMRVTLINPRDDGILMRNGLSTFQPVKTVLKQIRFFADAHKSEFFFLDFDFPFNPRDLILEGFLLDALRAELGEENFATAHVDHTPGSKRNGYYNTALTWDTLRKEKKQYIIIWQGQVESKLLWAPNADKIRNIGFEDGNLNRKTPEEIVEWLEGQLKLWKRENLFVTDLVNTPRFSPLGDPASRDRMAYKAFWHFISGKRSPANLGIVRHDFVNNEDKSYWDKRKITAHIIRMNKLLTPSGPDKVPHSSSVIDFNLNVNLIMSDGRHLFVDEKYGSEISFVSAASPEKINNKADSFLLQNLTGTHSEVKFAGTTKGLEDDILKKIFFIVHHDMRHADNQVNVGDQVVLSVGTEQKLGDQIHWGVWREDANNLEAFRFNDVDNINSNDPVYDGDLVLVRSKNDDKWWKVITDTTTESPTVRVLAAATSVADATQFTISRVR